MGTIKLDKDEMLKKASELSVLKDKINQDLAFNLVREFDKISDNFYQAAKAYESSFWCKES